MPIAEFKLPNGKIAEVNFPDGMPQEQMINHAMKSLQKSETQSQPQPTEQYQGFDSYIPIVDDLMRPTKEIGNFLAQGAAHGIDAVTGGDYAKRMDKSIKADRERYEANRLNSSVSEYVTKPAEFVGNFIAPGVGVAGSLGKGAVAAVKAGALSGAAAGAMQPVYQRKGNEGDSNSFLNELGGNASSGAVIGAATGGLLHGGTKILPFIYNKFKDIKNASKSEIDIIAKDFLNSISDELQDSPDAPYYFDAVKNIFNSVRQDKTIISPENLKKASSNLTDLSAVGFDGNVNDAFGGKPFKGKIDSLNGMEHIRGKVTETNQKRVDQGKGILNKISTIAGDPNLPEILGQKLSQGLGERRTNVRRNLNEKLQKLYQKSKYKPEQDAMVEKVIGQKERLKYTDINTTKPENIPQTEDILKVTPPPKDFTQRTKYPTLSFLTGRVKRGGRFAKELEAMDITPKSHPRLFSKNGQDSLDNIDAGEFPELADKYNLNRRDYFSENSLLTAISDELNGDPVKLLPDNMRASEVLRQRKAEMAKKEYYKRDADANFYDNNIQIDELSRPIEPNSRASVISGAEIEDVKSKVLDKSKGFKTIDDADVLGNSSIMRRAKSEPFPHLTNKSRPDYLKNPDPSIANAPLNSVERLHNVAKDLKQQIKAAQNNYAISGNKEGATSVAELQLEYEKLNDALKKNPDFKKADKLYSDLMGRFKEQDTQKFSKFIKTTPTSYGGVTNELLSDRTSVNQFKRIVSELEKNNKNTKQNVVKRGEILSTYLSDIMEKNKEETLDKIADKVFSSRTQKQKILHLTGNDKGLYKQIETSMKAMRNISNSISYFRGSQTAPILTAEKENKHILDNVALVFALKTGNWTGAVQAVRRSLGKFGGILDDVDKFTPDRRSQEVFFNVWGNPKNTKKTLEVFEKIRTAKDYKDVEKIVNDKNSVVLTSLKNILPQKVKNIVPKNIKQIANSEKTQSNLMNIENKIKNKSVQSVVMQSKNGIVSDDTYEQKVKNIESSGNNNAKSTTSSAQGLYGFTDKTWQSSVAKWGDKHGVKLSDRKNPDAQKKMFHELRKDDERIARTLLGRDVSDGERYVLHFMGAPKGVKLLKLAEKMPNVNARDVFSREAIANKSIFYNGKTPRTIKQVAEILKNKIEG